MKTFIATIALIATATTAAADADMFAAFDAAEEHRIAAAAYLECAADDLATLTGESNDDPGRAAFNERLGMRLVNDDRYVFTMSVAEMIKYGRVSVDDAKASTTNVLACYDTYFN